MSGARDTFRRTGYAEKEAVEFLKICSLGPAAVVREYLCYSRPNEELMDALGNNSVAFAVVSSTARAADQHHVLDVLLDYGVDVNACNDEHLTPLNLCLLRRLAVSHNLTDWETSFLPPGGSSGPSTEADKDVTLMSDENGINGWRSGHSVTSLDRVFGDGMSIDESEVAIRTELEEIQRWREEVEYPVPEEAEDFPWDYSAVTLLSCDIEHNRSEVNVYAKMIPEPSQKRAEYVQSVTKTNKASYFFQLKLAPEPKEQKGKKPKAEKKPKNEQKKPKDTTNYELLAKLAEIDKTLEKLLERGADPNIGVVPQPTLHLALFGRCEPILKQLLVHGASPNKTTPPQWGSLTPLHVLVLMTPSQELVVVCELLLQWGANTEQETTAAFSADVSRDVELDKVQGRTPIQLLCSRADAEYIDPEGHLSRIVRILAAVSDNAHSYRGLSWLGLAMLTKNLKILRALLAAGVSPNDVMENDLGTPLHLLLSTTLQKRVQYETTVAMAELLIQNGAKVLKSLKHSGKANGTSVEFGRREIEEEEKLRAALAANKGKQNKSKKERDFLDDHKKLLKYLSNYESKICESRKKIDNKIKVDIIQVDNLTNHKTSEPIDKPVQRTFRKEENSLKTIKVDQVEPKPHKVKRKKNGTNKELAEMTKMMMHATRCREAREKLIETKKENSRRVRGINGDDVSDDFGTGRGFHRRGKDGKLGAQRREGTDGRQGDSGTKGRGGINKNLLERSETERGVKTKNLLELSETGRGVKTKNLLELSETGRGVKTKNMLELSETGRGVKTKNLLELSDTGRGVKTKNLLDLSGMGRTARGRCGSTRIQPCGTETIPCEVVNDTWPSYNEKVHLALLATKFPVVVRDLLVGMYNTPVHLLDVNNLLLPYIIYKDGRLYYRFEDKNGNTFSVV